MEQIPAPPRGMSTGMDFTEEDMDAALGHSLRNVGIGTAIGIPILWLVWGWPSMLLFAVGAAIAASGILEWRRLVSAILSRFDTRAPISEDASELQGAAQTAEMEQDERRKKPRPLWSVVFWFLLRLAVAAVVLYVSLKVLDGRVIALIGGLALAVLALTIEAIRLFYSWSM